MGKYEKRKCLKFFRKLGLPFMEAATMASVIKKSGGYFSPCYLPEAYTCEGVTFCECCGPDHYLVTTPSGYKVRVPCFCYWTLAESAQ